MKRFHIILALLANSACFATDHGNDLQTGESSTERAFSDGSNVVEGPVAEPFSFGSCHYLTKSKVLISGDLESKRKAIEWDLVERKQVREVAEGFSRVIVNGDSALFIGANGQTGRVQVLDLKQGKELSQFQTSLIHNYPVVLSSDGKTVAGMEEREKGTYRFNLAIYRDGKPKHILPLNLKTTSRYAISPDGKKVVLSTKEPINLQLIDVESGSVTNVPKSEELLKGTPVSGTPIGLPAITFIQGGKSIALVASNHLKIIDTNTGSMLFDYQPGSPKTNGTPIGLVTSRDGSKLAWIADISGQRVIEVMNLPAKEGDKPRRIHGIYGGSNCFAISPDGDQLLGISEPLHKKGEPSHLRMVPLQ